MRLDPNSASPEQLRMRCLEIAIEARACPDCAVDTAVEFFLYVMHGDDAEDHDDDDDGHCCLDGLVGPWGRA